MSLLLFVIENTLIFFEYTAFYPVAMQNNAVANGNSGELKDDGNPQPSTDISIQQNHPDTIIIDINAIQPIPAQPLFQPLVNTMPSINDIIDISSDDDDDDDVIFLPSSPQHQENQVHNQNMHNANNSQLPHISHQNSQNTTSNNSSNTLSRKSLGLLNCIGNHDDSTQNLFGYECDTPGEPVVFQVDDNEEDDDNEEVISDLDDSDSDSSDSDESNSDENDLNDNDSDSNNNSFHYFHDLFSNEDEDDYIEDDDNDDDDDDNDDDNDNDEDDYHPQLPSLPSFTSLLIPQFFPSLHLPVLSSSSNSRPVYDIDNDSDEEEKNSNTLSQNTNASTIKSDNSGKMYNLLINIINRTSYDCPICMEHPVKPLSTICGHIFCRKCLRELFKVNS